MNLSPHFALEELTISQTAARKGMSNDPSAVILARLEKTLTPGLERIRALLGKPLTINSGYRSPAVNKAIGGSPTSAHCQGYAADFICPAFGTPLEICEHLADKLDDFDQLIQEGAWVHVSFDPRNRRQLLTKIKGGYAAGIQGADA